MYYLNNYLSKEKEKFKRNNYFYVLHSMPDIMKFTVNCLCYVRGLDY